MMKIIIRSLPDQLAEAIRFRLLAGEIDPNSAIRQDALAAELGTSKIPLREALARLEQEGLILSIPNRGYFARPMDLAELEEIYALRLTLEPQAVSAGAHNASDADRQAAIDALEAYKANASNRDNGAQNRGFHLALIRPGHARLTFGILERLHLLADRYVCKHLEPLGRNERADREHDHLLDAWLRRDVSQLQILTKDHISATLTDLRNQLE
jgi:DNA-binding GntR family transcriptional regulator